MIPLYATHTVLHHVGPMYFDVLYTLCFLLHTVHVKVTELYESLLKLYKYKAEALRTRAAHEKGTERLKVLTGRSAATRIEHEQYLDMLTYLYLHS